MAGTKRKRALCGARLCIWPLEERVVPSFAAPVTYSVGEVPWSVAIGDFNGDGIPDLAVTNLGEFPVDPGQAVSVLLGNGDGTFRPETRYGTGRNPYHVAVGDFNGDGIDDLAVVNYFNASVSILLGVGDGTFLPAQTYDAGIFPRVVVVGDFTGSGIQDLAITNYSDTTVSILMGNGDGTFREPIPLDVGSFPAALAAADLTGNGIDDLVVTNDNADMMQIYLSAGDGTFVPSRPYAVGQSPRGLAVADLNGDGIPDVIVANQDDNTISVFLGNGDGTIQASQTYPVGDGPLSIAVADFNQDGIPDVVTANLYTTTISYLQGNRDGTLQNAVSYPAGAYPAAVAAADFNGDGYPDLAVVQALDPLGFVGVLMNNGDWSPHPGGGGGAPAPSGGCVHAPGNQGLACGASPKHGIRPFSQPPGQTPANILVNDPNEDGSSSQDTQDEPSILVDGSHILVSYLDTFQAFANPTRYTGVSISNDQGQTFTDIGSLPVNANGDFGDSVFGHDDQLGRIYVAALTPGGPVQAWRSDDDWQTIQPPINASPGRQIVDKDWMAVDNFSGPGQGIVYIVAHEANPASGGIYLYQSTDQGDSFGPNGGTLIVSTAGGVAQGPWVTIGPDHAVYVFWYDQHGTTQTIQMRKSLDRGQTFGPPVTVATLRTTGLNGDLGLGGFRSNAYPQAAVNPVTGDVYLVFNDKGPGGDRADVFFEESTDGGSTWSSPQDVIDDTTGNDQWQPALAVTPNGMNLGVFWYDRRNDPANVLIDRYGVIGSITSDTITFGANFRISDTSFPPAFGHDPAETANYMGDYDQAAADNQNFYVAWGDNRSPSRGHVGNNADVRFARIPIGVAAPSVVAIDPSGTVFPPVSAFRVTFNEPIDPSTATPDQFVITDPNNNPVNVSTIMPVDGSNNLQFDVAFDTQVTAGTYTITIGPFIADMNGNYMDQDGDGDNASDPQDQFNGSFTIGNPTIVGFALNGDPQGPGTSVRVTFNEPISIATFTPALISNFTDPDGNAIAVNAIAPIDGSNGTQFDITFDPQTTPGTYTLTIAPGILDPFGNATTDPFTGTFTITPGPIPGPGKQPQLVSYWPPLP